MSKRTLVIYNAAMIQNKLRIVLADQYLKIADLCRMTGLSHDILSKIYHNNFTLINLEHVNKICNALNVTLTEIFEYTPDE